MKEKVELSDLLPHFHLFPGFHSPPSLLPAEAPWRPFSRVHLRTRLSSHRGSVFMQRRRETRDVKFLRLLCCGEDKKENKQLSRSIDFFFTITGRWMEATASFRASWPRARVGADAL